MFCVALTGSVASGKSTAIDYFKKLGIHTISADAISRTLTKANSPLLHQITAHFGEHILLSSKELDRKQLRRRILQNADEKSWLEALLHPAIRQAIQEEIQHASSPYCVIEIPLLYDKKSAPYIDRILLITASRALQITRTMQRDGCSFEDALALLNAQKNLEKQHLIADDRIENCGSIEAFHQELLAVHQLYLKLADSAFTEKS